MSSFQHLEGMRNLLAEIYEVNERIMTGDIISAKAAIASKKQGKYWELHTALLGHEGKVTAAAVDEIAAAQGLDVAKLKADMELPEVAEAIQANHALAQSLAINGTPAFIIDTQVTPGYLPAGDLLAAIEEVRQGGGCKLC